MDNITEKFLSWYAGNRRKLPWRMTRDPYLIWISEIILQQTRVDQGIAYYLRFTERFPDVYSLAAAKEQEVLNLWQGLGYYSRARNLHHTARDIVDSCDGQFPDSYHQLIGLKGIGDYTASAILSIAFDKAYPVVDGNVIRVLSRIYGIEDLMSKQAGRNQIRAIAQELLPLSQPGDFNQAMMEFGALFCKPKNPGCQECIFREHCSAYVQGIVDRLPVMGDKIKQKKRFLNYFVFLQEVEGAVKICIRKRKGKDIWKNMYDFYLIEDDHLFSESEAFNSRRPFRDAELLRVSGEYRHLLTHQSLFARFFLFRTGKESGEAGKDGLIMINLQDLDHYPLPRLISKYIESQMINIFFEK